MNKTTPLGWVPALVASAIFFSATVAGAGTITVNSNADSGGVCPGPTCTLRQAILTATSGDTIDFAAGVTEIDLTGDQLNISKTLTIAGPGANSLTISAGSFGVFNITFGDVTLSGMTVTGGSNFFGGGIACSSTGTVTITGCIVSGNTTGGSSGSGGGILISAGTVNIIDSTISGNNSSRFGGGISNSAALTITGSTISENTASRFGGGIYNTGSLTVTNSTISGNAAPAFFGGGIDNESGTVGIFNSTVANNSANVGGGIYNTGTVTAKNTIIATNTDAGSGPDFYGTLNSQGYNLIGETVGTNVMGGMGNQFNVDPKLDGLKNNGGPSFTHALVPGSPALDKGLTSGPNTDQRGFTRPYDFPDIPNAMGGDGSDIGAFERQPTDPIPTPTPTPTPTPSPTPPATPTPTPTPAKSLNVSTRAHVQTGDNVMIGGFIVTGDVSKRVILRALGPSLQQSGLNEFLADPVLALHGPDGSLLTTNDNWKEDPGRAVEIQASGFAPSHDVESAIIVTLPPSQTSGYTAIVRGKSNGTGLGLVEVYDLEQSADSTLANISTRALVETGDNVVIGGFILGGENGSARIIVRALGPSLAQSNIANPLPDPTLELHDENGSLVSFNDNWEDNPAQVPLISAAGLQPQDDLESAIAATLPPGAYTAIVAGRDNSTGVGLVEVYNLD